MDVPSGAPDLNASVKLANNPDNQTYGWLVDPSGQAQAFQSNGIVTDQGGQLFYTNSLGTSLHVVGAGGRAVDPHHHLRPHGVGTGPQ